MGLCRQRKNGARADSCINVTIQLMHALLAFRYMNTTAAVYPTCKNSTINRFHDEKDRFDQPNHYTVPFSLSTFSLKPFPYEGFLGPRDIALSVPYL